MMKKILLLITLFLTVNSAFPQASAANADSLFTNDSLALVAVYNHCNGPEWQTHTNWLEGPLDSWYGVTVENRRVTALQLAGEWYAKFGLENSLPPQIGDLNALKILDLSYNNLNDTLPADIGRLDSLSKLNLAGNGLAGELPDTLWSLTNLRTLLLYENQFSGKLSGNIGRLINLNTLSLANNMFNDSVPAEIGNLINLKVLEVSDNEFSGNILENITSIDSLVHLLLEDNNFTGTVPPEIGNLKYLEFFDLRNNQFSGELPEEIGALTNLLSFTLDNNQFHGAIPPGAAQWTQINTINLENNNFHAIPVLVNSYYLEYLNLEGNRFTFEDIEPNLVLGHKKGDFFYIYNNQQKIGEVETKYAPPGEPFTLSVYCGGRNNRYQWFKDGTEVSEVSDSAEYVIENVEEGNNGDYFCRITNAKMPNLTIESHPVTVVGRDSLIANAGHDFAAAIDSVVTLNATASYSPDDKPLTYSWTAPENIELTGADSAEPQFTAPEVVYDTPFTFMLLVDDGTNEAEDEVVVTVRARMITPVARAGADQIGFEGEEVELDGTHSYSAYGEHTFRWTVPEGIELTSDFDPRATFMVPQVDADTVFIFSLVINDGVVDSAPDTVRILVYNYTEVPVADAGDSLTVDAGETVTLDGSGSTDPQGYTLSFVWLAPEGITLNDPDQPQSSFVAPEFNTDTTLTFYLVVTNSNEFSDTASVDITIRSVAVGVPIVTTGKIQVYPNPSNGHITILLNEVEAAINYRLIVTSASGVRILDKQLIDSGTTNLDLSSQNPGVYFIQLIDKNDKYVERIMIR